MKPFTVHEIADAVGGVWQNPRDGAPLVAEVSTDSRKFTPGCLFIPLRGEKFDGHRFVEGALEAGAAGVICAQLPEQLRPDKFYILVADTRLALKELARANRRRYSIPFVQITGSVGKTTTKEMIATVLSARYNVLKTQGNFNNDIGTPLTLLGLVFGCIGMASGYLMHLRGTKEEKAFAMVNYSVYNIGNFTMPFVQSFMGPVGVITTSLFDVGNAVVCLGGSASVADVVRKGGRLSLGKLLRAMGRSVSFITYVTMTVLTLCRVTLPATLLQWVSIPANANVFLSMLMIGVGFSGVQNAGQWRALRRFFVGRYGLAVLLAVACWFVLPFDAEIRRTLMVLVFAPVASSNLPFTREIEGDVGLASTMNSISCVVSTVLIVVMLSILG